MENFSSFIIQRFLTKLRENGFLHTKSRQNIIDAVHQVLVWREFNIQQNEALAVSKELVHALGLSDVHAVVGAYNTLSELPETKMYPWNCVSGEPGFQLRQMDHYLYGRDYLLNKKIQTNLWNSVYNLALQSLNPTLDTYQTKQKLYGICNDDDFGYQYFFDNLLPDYQKKILLYSQSNDGEFLLDDYPPEPGYFFDWQYRWITLWDSIKKQNPTLYQDWLSSCNFNDNDYKDSTPPRSIEIRSRLIIISYEKLLLQGAIDPRYIDTPILD